MKALKKKEKKKENIHQDRQLMRKQLGLNFSNQQSNINTIAQPTNHKLLASQVYK